MFHDPDLKRGWVISGEQGRGNRWGSIPILSRLPRPGDRSRLTLLLSLLAEKQDMFIEEGQTLPKYDIERNTPCGLTPRDNESLQFYAHSSRFFL